MASTTIMTQATPFAKARSVNQTSTSFVSKVPTNTEPTGDAATATGASIIDMANLTSVSQNMLLVAPYAVATNDQTFSVRVIGWTRIGSDPRTWMWIPVLLAEVLCTCDDTLVGAAGKQIIATEMFCDTITLTSGNDNVSIDRNSPADGVSIAHFLVDTKGCQKVEFSFSTGSSATSCNALWRPL